MRAHCTGRRALGGLAPSSAPFCLGIGKVETKGTDRFSSGVNPSWWSPKEAAGGSVVLGRALHTPFSAARRQNHGSLGFLVRQKGARSPFVLRCPVWRVRVGVPLQSKSSPVSPQPQPPGFLLQPSCPQLTAPPLALSDSQRPGLDPPAATNHHGPLLPLPTIRAISLLPSNLLPRWISAGLQGGV